MSHRYHHSSPFIRVTGSLKHRNIINMISREESPRHVVLAFELMEGMTVELY